MIQLNKYFTSMRSYLFAYNNMGAVPYLKLIKVDGKFPINIYELWLKPEKISPTCLPK